MKKIIFNDRFNLTKLVLEGRKNMTRRFINSNYTSIIISEGIYLGVVGDKEKYVRIIPKYELGEVVAIAQSYQQVENDFGSLHIPIISEDHPGWHNKMFVKAECMPYRIRITNIKVERLQDISDEDCLKEGITEVSGEFEAHTVLQDGYYGERIRVIKRYYGIEYYELGESPREAYGTLIDKISGKGTWKSNPWVLAYEFELIK